MSWATSEAVSVLAFLLPGFVAVIVFYALTSHPKPSELERIVQALAFTIAAQAISSITVHLIGFVWAETAWPEFEEAVVPFVTAVVLALMAVLATNHDFPHKLFRRIGLTRETSYPSEWYAAFAENLEHYVVLHLKDGRRLFGWPEEYPGRPDQGHFLLANCEWLVGEERRPLTGVSVILIPAQDVNMIEFIATGQLEDSNSKTLRNK